MVQHRPTIGLFLSSSTWCFVMAQNEEILGCLKSLSTKFDALAEDVEQLKRSQLETAATNHGRVRSETPLLAIINACWRHSGEADDGRNQ